MTKTKIIEQVFDVYGADLQNNRSLFSAQTKSPVAMLSINKAFGSWNKFYRDYIAYVANVRKEQAAAKVVTKKTKKAKDDE